MTIICKSKTASKRHTIEPIYGDCLERAGLHIPHGGMAIIRQGLKIKVGDLVHCSRILGEIPGMIKQVQSIVDGTITVGSAYLDRTRDFTFEAVEIYGVVTEVFDKVWHSRVYDRKTALAKVKGD